MITKYNKRYQVLGNTNPIFQKNTKNNYKLPKPIQTV